ncbi:hypothetical protein F5B22DRAFT_391143 [Xylaria bambusicola]|uniref:uncharacterized protein n=1 Tax=Xylaria bambusicola TaxID=326684 RepID=UPI002007D2EA|nr:uncharacterized protein F5B22DRAFT_391143 [Xylaria bambusicola]KAI0508544.1 hypothetical protein F5B22DRAFT_391143 [Xylaria bambusicola]
MAADTNESASQYKIIVIPVDDDGCRFYLEQYRPFRLASLQQDPQAFGSTYEREIAFDEETWLGRIKNPLAKTFVAVRTHSNQIVASTSLIGPLPNATVSSNPYQVITAAPGEGDTKDTNSNSDSDDSANKAPVYFQMSAVYTLPTARGCGLAKALIKAATGEACDRAHSQRRPLALSVVVYPDNAAAISVYERCGFARNPEEEPELVVNEVKKTSEWTVNMYYSGEP